MTKTLDTASAPVSNQHHENIIASLHRRLEAARATEDTHLLELLEQERQQVLQLVPHHAPRRSLKDSLALLWQDVVDLLQANSHLQVWQAVDDTGNLWWCAYNPETGESVYADSETEMRLWIKQHA